ncbi:NmrA family protein [Colletotrichum higginsianum IMI 349063]|uniref:NmrA family protein n=1 Tax=Colletotrichum higginsianum (strain IMI 349063) TaxID=759273 RepID=A0A1B7XSC7_COLHI|nr:NmrA family protein [Colletotrichum higginsianum IMI 349063]OBR02673.1 NmrA family protein [Colletotrichum higginsianum IMI 349063]
MSESKVLVLGGTGPAGICLLRELVHREHETIVFARNPSKIPRDLLDNSRVEVLEGQMSDTATLSSALARTSVVVSLLGPDIRDRTIDPSLYADIYRSHLFPLMRQHRVKRILAMGTLTICRPEDHWTLMQTMVTTLMPLFNSAVYRNMLNIARLFDEEGQNFDWTIFRIAQIPGASDEASWRQDREGGIFTGWIGEKGWMSSIRRAGLARWLVNAVEGKAEAWVGKMPAVSSLAH